MPTTRRARTKKVPAIVRQLCDLVSELNRAFQGRRFTLDGHLVGSIGEVLTADFYGLALLPTGEARHDARDPNGTLVQIKTTQASSVGLRSRPDHLLVVQLDARGTISEVYNGPGKLAWDAAGKMQSNGQRQIRVAKLRALMETVPQRTRLPASGRP
jgi:hypothetical protein